MTEEREVLEGMLHQGKDESIPYSITTTPWGTSPGTISVAAFDVSAGAYTDVTSTVIPGSASAVGDVITLPNLLSLTQGHKYRIEVKFTCSGKIFECYFYVWAEL